MFYNKDQDMDKDLHKDKDFALVLKEFLRTRTNITDVL